MSWWVLYALLYGVVVGFVAGALVVAVYRDRRDRRARDRGHEWVWFDDSTTGR
jgi:heme/copper-type cytochrome/quinol oxidase subunit 2